MRAKAYLEQIAKYDKIITNRLRDQARLQELATSITANYSDGPRVQSSGDPHRAQNAMDKWVDLSREIDELVDKRIDIIRDLETLNATEYELLELVYVQCLTLYAAADKMDKSYSWVTTVHGRALKNVQSILDARAAIADDVQQNATNCDKL